MARARLKIMLRIPNLQPGKKNNRKKETKKTADHVPKQTFHHTVATWSHRAFFDVPPIGTVTYLTEPVICNLTLSFSIYRVTLTPQVAPILTRHATAQPVIGRKSKSPKTEPRAVVSWTNRPLFSSRQPRLLRRDSSRTANYFNKPRKKRIKCICTYVV
ncbi:hypothetical protein DM02DRAFT_105009 [Periconia macrospinosa]|uniref:Uncharacterized protein n=1 Tax=Periconia macrospinosa TaxID=97972 RepID=A0A2V1DGJ2_9PLEO|nr:hypothetical protein DM02DRAFT_105009 [Periconia macrospinosa]